MHDLLLVLSTLVALASGQTCTTSSSLTWSTSNGNILLNGQPFVLKGINWFGFETETFSPHGLWGGATTLKAVLDLLVNNGFNALRIPFSLEMIQSNPKTNINCGDNPDVCGKPALETLSIFIDKCAERGILVLLDYHRITSQGGITELWYDSTYPEAVVIQLWQKLLALVGNKWNVFAIDLKNEPHGQATWGYGNNATDWNTAAERMIRALAPSFKGLFFVEGVEANAVGSSMDAHFWGENLEGVRTKPIDTGDAALNKRVVYANHVYGPDVYNQPYFNTGDFPRNMANIWTTHFGFAEKLTGTPIVLGEWGGHYAAGTKDDAWANTLSEYLIANCLSDTFYWCLNPNGGDTGGLLGDDWKTVNVRKLELLRKIQPNPTKLTVSGGQVCIRPGSYPNAACGSTSPTSATTKATAATTKATAATTKATAATSKSTAATTKATAATTKATAATTKATAANTKATAATTKAPTVAPPPPPTTAATQSPPSSGGSVSVTVQTVNSWQGGAQINIVLTNNGASNVCGVTLKMIKDATTTIQSLWNLDAAGSDQYTTPNYVNLAKGQSHTAGTVLSGNPPSFSVVSTKTC